MSDPDNERVFAKILKLMALSDSPNLEEASSALQKAHDLLVKYNLSLDTVTTEAPRMKDIPWRDVRKMEFWKKGLINEIANFNFCGVYVVHQERITILGKKRTDHVMHIVGQPQNVASTRVMVDYLLATIDRIAHHEHRRVWGSRESLKMGITDSLVVRLRAMTTKDEASSDSRTLVVHARSEIALHLARIGVVMRKIDRQNFLDTEAYLLGREKGNEISLNRQVAGPQIMKKVGASQ